MLTTEITVIDDVISIKVPITLKRHGGRKYMILPDGVQTATPRRHPDLSMVRALAKAYLWQKQLDAGQYRSLDDLARQKQINPSYVSRILRLNQLAPAVKRVILDGTQPVGLNMDLLQRPFPDLWTEQLRYFGIPNSHPASSHG